MGKYIHAFIFCTQSKLVVHQNMDTTTRKNKNANKNNHKGHVLRFTLFPGQAPACH